MKLQYCNEEEQFKNCDFDGYYVEGFKDGERVMLAGVIDVQSRTNFFIIITFDDKDDVAEKDALKILIALFYFRSAALHQKALHQKRGSVGWLKLLRSSETFWLSIKRGGVLGI